MRKVGSMFSHHFFCFYLRRVILIVAVAFLGFSFVPQIGLAQQDLPVPDAPSIRKMIGIVGIVLPDYVGSDDYTVVPAPLFTYKFMVLRKSLDSTQVRFVLERVNLVLKGQEFTTSLLAHEFVIGVT